MLLKYQEDNLKRLIDSIKTEDAISIIGDCNTGRTEVVMTLKNDNTIIIKIKADKESNKNSNDKNYKDILSAIEEIKAISGGKISTSLEISLSCGIGGISLGLEKNELFALKKEILKRLKLLSIKKNIIIVIKNPQNLDLGTQEIIGSLFKSKRHIFFKKRLIKIEICDKEQYASGKKLFFYKLDDHKESYYLALEALNLKPDIKLSDIVIDFIFKNAKSNIKLISDIVQDLNTNNIDIEFKCIDNNSSLYNLINYSLATSNYSSDLKNILTILSICKRHFTSLDLSFILNKENNVVETYLNYAVEHNFLAVENYKYQIVFNIIKEIFSKINIDKQQEIHNYVIKLISVFYPDQYYEKYKFAKLAKKRNASIYLIQEIMKQIITTGKYDYNFFVSKLSESELSIVNEYHRAYSKSSNNLFDDAVKILETAIIKYNLTSPLKQEFNLLLSQCLIKSINQKSRCRAINLLNYDDKDEYIDEYLKYRLDARKISACIHNGLYKDALIQYDTTYNRLVKIVENNKSPGCEYFLNILLRKNCNIHSYESSIAGVEKSVEFFSKQNQYSKDYYIALNNALALNLINGKQKNAERNITQLNELKEKYFNIRFPRPELLRNNLLIYDLLYNTGMKKESIVSSFETLYNDTKGLADNILIASNYAICLALNNNVRKSIEILNAEKDKFDKNPENEGIYIYRIKANLAICEFINNNDMRAKSLKLLYEINIPEDDIHSIDRNKELNLIIQTMKNISECNSANKWIEAYQLNLDTPMSYYCLYQYGFVFTTLFDWDVE